MYLVNIERKNYNMRREYNKPLIHINEIHEKDIILALDISSSPMNWTAEDENESGYKEFEW